MLAISCKDQSNLCSLSMPVQTSTCLHRAKGHQGAKSCSTGCELWQARCSCCKLQLSDALPFQIHVAPCMLCTDQWTQWGATKRQRPTLLARPSSGLGLMLSVEISRRQRRQWQGRVFSENHASGKASQGNHLCPGTVVSWIIISHASAIGVSTSIYGASTTSHAQLAARVCREISSVKAAG